MIKMSLLQKTVAKFMSSNSTSEDSQKNNGKSNSIINDESTANDLNQQFKLIKTLRYGYLNEVLSFDYDTCQHLLAIGNRQGIVKIYGQETIESYLYHQPVSSSVLFIRFVINEGALITYCEDLTLNLWSLRQKQPAISFTKKLINERATALLLPFQNKWLFVGTERGNVYILNFYNNFSQSGYDIKWNNIIDLTQKTHPGKIRHLSEHPQDNSKLLIAFDSGLIVLWNIKLKKADLRFYSFLQNQQQDNLLSLLSISWLYDGKQFMSSHVDGYLFIWSTKCDAKPPLVLKPHMDKTNLIQDYSAITKIEVINENLFVFSGGISTQSLSTLPLDALTIVRNNKNKTIIEFESKILDFHVINLSPWSCTDEPPDSQAIILLFETCFEIIDLKTEGFPKYSNACYAHLNDINCISYLIDPDWKLMQSLLVLMRQRSTDSSSLSTPSHTQYPIDGGIRSITQKESLFPYNELIALGYDDGSIRLYDATGLTLSLMCKIKTYKLFDKKRIELNEYAYARNPFKVTNICMRSVYVACSCVGSYVILYKYNSKKPDQSDEGLAELTKLEIQSCFTLDSSNNTSTSDSALTPSSTDSSSNSNRKCDLNKNPYKLRIGLKRQLGYQPELIAMLTWSHKQPQINCLDLNINLSLLIIGTTESTICIDINSKLVLFNISLNDIKLNSPNELKVKSPTKKGTFIKNREESLLANSDDALSGSENSNKILNNLFARQFTLDQQNNPPPKDTISIHSDSSVFEDIPKVHGVTYTNVNDHPSNTSVWCGTSDGLVTIFNLFNTNASVIVEDDSDFGSSSPNITIKTSNIKHSLRGSIVFIAFIDAYNDSSNQQQYASDDTKIMNKVHKKLVSTKSAKFDSTLLSSIQTQFAILCSQHEIKLISLPSQNCLFKHQFNDDDSCLRANIFKLNNLSYLQCFMVNGHLYIFNLPSLKLNTSLMLQSTNKDDSDRICKSLVISDKGHLLYMCSSSEIQKLFIASNQSILPNLNELLPELFNPKITTPHAPKPNIFKSFFSNTPIDRELLFGESSGKPSVNIIKSMDTEVQKVNREMSELQKAAMLRGEKLSQLDQRAEELNMAASEHARLAKELSTKYKKKNQWF